MISVQEAREECQRLIDNFNEEGTRRAKDGGDSFFHDIASALKLLEVRIRYLEDNPGLIRDRRNTLLNEEV